MRDKIPSSLTNIRLVAVDLDGTLLNRSKELPDGAAEVFRTATQAGLHISIITGRNACSVQELEKCLLLSGPHASSGGAMVFGQNGYPVYLRHTLKKEDIRQAVEISRRWNLAIFLQSADRILMENENWYHVLKPAPFFPCKPEPCTDIIAALNFEPLKVTLYGNPPDLANALTELKQDNSRFHITSAGEEDIELTCAWVNKGSALREISTITGIPLQNILAIGDSPNDVSMFHEAGLAVAVGNAHSEAKQAAAIIAPTNEDGGVLWAIQNLALPTLRGSSFKT